MTFSYSGNPASSQKDAVRFLLNDTEATDVLLQNEEIDFLIGQWSDTYEIARAGAEIIASKFSREADSVSKTVGDLSLSKSFNDKASQYRALAKSFYLQRLRKTPPIPTINPEAIESTANRSPFTPTTDFHVGQFDNPSSYTDSSTINAE